VDVIEDASGITLYADLPGVPKDKLHLQVEADTLTIEGEIDLEMPGGIEASHAEVSLPRYRRVFTLSKELDASKVSAEFSHGVLKLSIPKAEHAQPRKVEVKVPPMKVGQPFPIPAIGLLRTNCGCPRSGTPQAFEVSGRIDRSTLPLCMPQRFTETFEERVFSGMHVEAPAQRLVGSTDSGRLVDADLLGDSQMQ
jgi:HSP20 family protein